MPGNVIAEAFVAVRIDPRQLEADLRAAAGDLQVTARVAADTASLAPAIQDAVEASDTQVTVTADAEPVAGEISAAVAEADTLVPVTADVTGARSELETIGDGVSVEVPVEVDTTAAQAEVEQLGQSAQTAAGGTEALGGAVGNLGAVTDLAGGKAQGLGQALQGMGGKAGIAGAALLPLAGFTGLLFQNAVDAEAATFRFENTLGDMASTVDEIDVGGLSEGISDLTLRLGSGDDELRNVVSSFFQLGQSAGRSRQEVGVAAEQLVALAARARALNPELGSVDSIAQSLQGSLARGGPSLAAFGIALTSSEIEARALADTGKAASDELTQFDKAAAGAALATERLGSRLREDIDKGAENPAIRLAALTTKLSEFLETLGTPLVAPIFEILEELEPVAEEVAKSLADVIVAGLPIVELFADLLPVVTVALKPLQLLAAAVVLIEDAVAAAVGPIQDFIDLLGDLPVISQLVDAVGFVGDAVGSATDAIGDAAGAVADFVSGGEELHGTVVEMGEGFETAEEKAARFARQIGETTELVRRGVVAQGEAIAGAFAAAVAGIDEFVASATGALPSVADAFDAVGEDSVLSVGEFVAALDASAATVGEFRDNLALLAAEGFTGLAATIAEQGPAVGGALAEELATALESGNREIVDGVQAATDAFNAEWTSTVEFFRSTLGPEFILSAGLMGSGAAAAFGRNLTFAERVRVAGELAKSGLDQQGQAIAAIAAVEGEHAARLYGENLGLEAVTVDAAVRAGQAIRDHAPVGAYRDAGIVLGDAFNDGVIGQLELLGRLSAQAATRAISEGLQITRTQFGIQSPSKVWAERLGRPIGEGIAVGLAATQSDVTAAGLSALSGLDSLSASATVAGPTAAVAANGAAPAAGGAAGGSLGTVEALLGELVSQFRRLDGADVVTLSRLVEEGDRVRARRR
jgi:hypothetical protein